MAWIGDSTEDDAVVLAYASNALVYLTAPPHTQRLANGVEHRKMRRVVRTLRTSALENSPTNNYTPTVVTAIASVQRGHGNVEGSFLIAGFSNGMLQVWSSTGGRCEWEEHAPIIDKNYQRSITTLDALWLDSETICIVIGTSAGAFTINQQVKHPNGDGSLLLLDCSDSVWNPLSQPDNKTSNSCFAIKTVHFVPEENILLVGTAAPRYNQILVYSIIKNSSNTDTTTLQYRGALVGHEDWITSFSYRKNLLASASQDAKIRLWRWTTTNTATSSSTKVLYDMDEARLAWTQDNDDFESLTTSRTTTTSISLEALLYGHEESVTGVVWHPDPEKVFGLEAVLLSSGMDRCILLWAPNEAASTAGSTTAGVWTPLRRLGSAGGILGGSVGSSLLGYCSVVVDPVKGQSIVSHAYGGTLHVWNLEEMDCGSGERTALTPEVACNNNEPIPVEDRMLQISWEAGPSITGHFSAVTDMCWDTTQNVLFTVSSDETCRMWTQLPAAEKGNSDGMWVEVARPQVHGHAINAVTSISTTKQPLRLISGATEKEIRVFEAPRTSFLILHAASNIELDQAGRVDRAFIPSLGLSNKASAADAAEESKVGVNSNEPMLDSVESMQLPQERDLGAVSLWPETECLFGHNTEIYCLASTASCVDAVSSHKPILVASSAKAREPEDAQIRLWDVDAGTCVQVLQNGHKSTVACLSFSSSGNRLVSSGKDRRLCLWERNLATDRYELQWAKDSAHKRIVWSVDFLPWDEKVIASGSRDGSVKIWNIGKNVSTDNKTVVECGKFSPEFHRNGKPDAVTALAFAPIAVDEQAGQRSLLAVGLESGRIEFWNWDDDAKIASKAKTTLCSKDCHVSSVTRLSWKQPSEESASLLLASCSSDHGCRIFSVYLGR